MEVLEEVEVPLFGSAKVKLAAAVVIREAVLDVLEEEGYIVDELNLLSGHPNEQQLKTILANHELMQMDNVIVTPHNAFNTKEALERIINTSIDNIKAFISGTPQNTVVK
jgi:D-lactate dehydrogenase